MFFTRIREMIYFKAHKKPKKKNFVTYWLVGNQHTALGRTEGKSSESLKHFELGI